MGNINNTTELQARIIELQAQGEEESIALRAELSVVMENVNPVHLLANGLKEIIASPEVKNELFSLTLGMSAGYIAKKIVIGNSENPLQQIAGNVVGMVVSNNVADNSDKIRSTALLFLNNFLFKKKTKESSSNQFEE